MKIQQWLGFNEDTSQYLLRTGELRALVNLQPRRAGMLMSRPGIVKLYGKYDDESVVGLYRRDTVFGNPNDFLLFQKSIADRNLTAAQIAAKEFPQEDVWIVRRIQGFQERVIAQLASSPNGSSKIANFCVCEDRHGRMFLFFGHGAEPLMYRPASLATVAMPLGMDPPLVAPVVVPDGSGYFIESIDVTGTGGGFYAPPSISVEGGSPDRPAKVKGLVQGGSLVGIDVEDGGANFKSFPKITVSSDSVGAGFRAVGNLETDPGVQGFVSTTAGVVSGTPPAASETVGATNGVLGNSIMYRSSNVVATTKTVALADPQAIPPDYVPDVYEQVSLVPNTGKDTRFMMVESLNGILPGDLVTIQGASQPYPFGPTAIVRVDSIDSRPKTMENKSVKAIRLSKAWQPDDNASYTVQFRRESDVAYAKATWDSTRKRFRASVPLRTISGTGRGAEATLEFSPAAYGYGLGTFTTSGWTTPTGGVESARFAFQQVGWKSYINGEYWEGSAQDKKSSKENKTYAGLQASGSSYVFGYSGSVSEETKGKSSNRRADVYWPDYSKISVWVCTGTLQSNISRWTRLDATVHDGHTDNPYAIVDLKPTANSQISTQTGKLSYSSVATNYGVADDFRYPKIKIKLKRCPDSWVISTQTNGSFDYNLPSSEKEKQEARIGWWHSASTTPRPIVDVVRNTANAISWDTVEVLDPGAGWEMGTQFAIRLHQANPYDQRTDYNTAVREQTIKAGHQPFSTSDRYVQFLFKATEPDDLTPAGPPGPLAGSQYVDVAGTGYRAGDKAAVTILKRPLSSGVASDLVDFDGVFAAGGLNSESSSVITGTRTNTDSTVKVFIGGVEIGNATAASGSATWTFTIRRRISSLDGITVTASPGTATISGISSPAPVGAIIRTGVIAKTDKIKVGDVLECSDPGVLLPGTTVIAKRESGGAYFLDLDKCRGPNPSSFAFIYGVQSDTPTGRLLKLTDSTGQTLTTPNEYWKVGQVLRANTPVNGVTALFRLTQLITSSDGLFATVEFISGESAWVQGLQSYLPSFTIRAVGGIAPAQTVEFTAEQILAGTGEQKVTSVRIVSGGRDYYAPPEVLVRGGGGGYGLAVTPIVDGGKVTACEITDPGRAYTQSPELYTDSSPATAVPVMRPTMRGKYRCAYRFVDRSETEILSTEISRCRGDRPTRLQLGSTAGIKPGMFLESERLPQGTKVLSVHGNEVEVNQEATGEGYIGAVVVENPGSGYTQTEAITVSVPGSVGASLPVVRRLNDEGSYSVDSVTVSSAGTSKFPVGKIPLTFSAPASGGSVATGYAVISRFDTASTYNKSVLVRDYSKPTSYSSFSPIIDVDAGPNDSRTHSSEMKWTIPGVTPPTRADMVELWRTSADQSLVFYRLEAYGKPTDSGVEIVGTDTLNDEELFDPERPNYAAMPVVLPNGNLNAYRFGKPRTDMSVCVAFQDRLWYGVSTSGDDANTLFYSEFDEFESCPDTYDLPIQNNQRATDSLTALVPYGSMLLAMQNAHTYSVTYNTDPSIDGAIQMLTHRGCLHQRCWDMDNGVFYSVDESGIYSMDRSGNIQDLSQPFREWFTSELLDFAKRDRFFLTICPKTRILRFFCCLTTQEEDSPTFALCLDLDRKTWWSENYPNSVCSAVTGRPGKARINSSILGAVDGNMYELTGDRDHANQTLVKCTVTNGGKGYKRSPKITCPSSKGVQLKGVISEGRLVDILVLSGGWDLKWGTQLLTETGTRLDDPISATVTSGAAGTNTVAVANASQLVVGRLVTIPGYVDEPCSITAITVIPGVTNTLVYLSRNLTATVSGSATLYMQTPYPYSINSTPLGSVQLATHDGRLLQGAEYAPVVLDIEAPPDGGTQATAVADYSVTQRLIRDCTVSQGEDFVRLRTFVSDPVDSYIPPFITTHDGLKLLAVGGAVDSLPFRAQPQAVEVGMEAIGDFIPLNAFVSRIDGADIYLEHPDGTPVSVLGGNARTDTYPVDGYKESGGSQAIVYFRKAYHTHIPFRLATGAMQLLNEENITRNGDGLIDRSVSLVFAPTDTKKEVEIIQYYNDSSTPRANVMRRSRGGPGGFEHRQDSASTVLNLERSASLRADATGVAKAMFAGRVYTDATGEDQHIQVELYGRPASANGGTDLVAQKFVMHSMTVNGVIDNGE